MLFILILIGSAIFVSIAILHIRKSAFERQLEVLAERKRRRLGRRALTFNLSGRKAKPVTDEEEAIVAGVIRGQAIQDDDPNAEYQPSFAARERTRSLNEQAKPDEDQNGHIDSESQGGRIRFGDEPKPSREATGMADEPQLLRRATSSIRPLRRSKSYLPAMTGVGSHSIYNHPRNAVPAFYEEISDEEDAPARTRSSSLAKFDKYYDQLNGFVGRNSRFSQLTEKERRILGGIEYDAICFLSWLVPLYWVLFQLLGALGMGAYFYSNHREEAEANGECMVSINEQILIA